MVGACSPKLNSQFLINEPIVSQSTLPCVNGKPQGSNGDGHGLAREIRQQQQQRTAPGQIGRTGKLQAAPGPDTAAVAFGAAKRLDSNPGQQQFRMAGLHQRRPHSFPDSTFCSGNHAANVNSIRIVVLFRSVLWRPERGPSNLATEQQHERTETMLALTTFPARAPLQSIELPVQ
jgi:hypothetical protein